MADNTGTSPLGFSSEHEESPDTGSIAQMRQRLLERASAHIDAIGLTVASTDDVIAQLRDEAGVSREAFTHIWATENDFLVEVFCALANQAQIDRADVQTLVTTWQFLGTRSADLRTPEGRRALLGDIIRTAAAYNFDVVTASHRWSTYAALSATILSWPDAEGRERMVDALRASELAFVGTMENFYRNVLPTIGYRLKPAFHGDYQPFVVAAASVIEGLGMVRATIPVLVGTEFEIDADRARAVATSDTTRAVPATEQWSIAALAFMGVVDAFIEPDAAYDAEEAIARLSSGVDVSPQAE